MASRKTEREAKRLLLTMSPVCARGRILQVAFHPCIVKVVPERFFRMASTAATSSSACSVVRLSLARGCCGCCSSVFVAANGRSCSISSSSSLTASEACVSSNDSAGSFSGSSAIETSESAAVTTRAAISLHTTTALALRPSAPTGRSGSSLWLRLIHVATSIGCSSIAPTAAAVRAPDRGSARRERDGRRAGGLGEEAAFTFISFSARELWRCVHGGRQQKAATRATKDGLGILFVHLSSRSNSARPARNDILVYWHLGDEQSRKSRASK